MNCHRFFASRAVQSLRLQWDIAHVSEALPALANAFTGGRQRREHGFEEGVHRTNITSEMAELLDEVAQRMLPKRTVFINIFRFRFADI